MRVDLLTVHVIILLTTRGVTAWSLQETLSFFFSSWPGYGESREPNVVEDVGEENPGMCECEYETKKRIVGGVETLRHEYPFAVNIVDSKYKRAGCGGTLISHNLVLTAAHCAWNTRPSELTVVLGEHDMRDKDTSKVNIRVKNVIFHDDYNDQNYKNDIAILVLEKDAPLKKGIISLVCLPTSKLKLKNYTVRVVGWGRTSDNGPPSRTLRKVDLQTADISRCRRYFGNTVDGNRQICTYTKSKDSCQGDSGGPLLYKNPKKAYVQVGIVSFGGPCASSIPGVNTDVTAYLDWIQAKIKTYGSTKESCKSRIANTVTTTTKVVYKIRP